MNNTLPPAPGLPRDAEGPVFGALGSAGLRDDGGAARARPVHLARMGRGAQRIAAAPGRRRGRRRHLLPALAGRARRTWWPQGRELADELARYQHAWDHAADRTPHGQPIELRGEDFPG
jgi:hypothetical protein